jgi:HSF-type DNA-binding
MPVCRHSNPLFFLDLQTILDKNPEPVSDVSDDDIASVPRSIASELNKSVTDGKKSPNVDAEQVDDSSFPERLMGILQSGTVDHAMKWVASGEAVAIMSKNFEKAVLEEHFHGSKYSSFTRKLNRW